MPAPNKSIEELAKVSPELPRLLPGLAAMVTPGTVSPFYAALYETKLRKLRAGLTRLDQLLSRHNFYDCQTVLHLKHPETQRVAVLLQSEMDVDADGSDSDRLPEGSGTSPNFQPFTSYRWPKKTQNPSAYLGLFEERIKTYETEAGLKTTNAARKAELKSAIASARESIGGLKKFSFLIGATDPYIVIPGGFTKAEGAKVGDLAVVIYGDAIYPAIVGDVGPSDKAGEASLRIAKEISANANPMYRPVSDLAVTYLIFPDSAETPFGPPDLDKMHERCDALVNEIGGAGVPLHKWENIIPPPPTPTPIPRRHPRRARRRRLRRTVASGRFAFRRAGGVARATFAFPLPSASPSATPSPSPTAAVSFRHAAPNRSRKPKSLASQGGALSRPPLFVLLRNAAAGRAPLLDGTSASAASD